MKYSIVLIVLLIASLVACTVPDAGESLVPDEGLPTVTQKQAEKIAAGESQGDFVGSRLVNAIPEGKPARGFAELAWEVQFKQIGEGFFDMIYVSAMDGSIVRKSVVSASKYAWTTDGDNLLPEDEAVAALADKYGVKESSVTMVHVIPDDTSARGNGPVLAYEIKLEHDNWVDLIYVDIETGKVIRTAVVSASRMGN